ncbi:phospholipase-like protein [Tanacetum coccineum]
MNRSSFESTAIVLNMEKIMRIIVEESEKLAIELQDLLLTSIRKDNQSGSPVCWKFGQKVLMICAAKLKPIDRRSIALCIFQGGKETIPSTTETSKVIDKMKLECPATINMMQTLRQCKDTSMALKSVTEMNGKRKRNDEQLGSETVKAPFVEHGEILVGRKIRVWRAKDEIYRPGVVKSFDCKLKMHKVLFDDGFEVVIDLKMKRWMFEKLSAIPDSSAGPALREVIISQLDICAAIRTLYLRGFVYIVRRIETNDLTNIISSIDEIESQVYAAEAAKINVSWLQTSLNDIHKRNEAGKKVTMLMNLKSNTTLAKRAAGTDRKERHAKLVTAQNQFAEAQRCEEVLKLKEKKLNDDVLEYRLKRTYGHKNQLYRIVDHARCLVCNY